MEASVYMSRFRYWLDGRRLLSMALERTCPHVMIQILAATRLLGLVPVELLSGTGAIGSEFLQLFLPCRQTFQIRCDQDLHYSLRLFNFMRSAMDKWSFHDCLRTMAIPILWDHWEPIRRPTAYTRELALERRMRVQQTTTMFLGWHNREAFVGPFTWHLDLYLTPPAR